MKEFNNNQWDDKYPVTEHFEEDINTETLYVLEENDNLWLYRGRPTTIRMV